MVSLLPIFYFRIKFWKSECPEVKTILCRSFWPCGFPKRPLERSFLSARWSYILWELHLKGIKLCWANKLKNMNTSIMFQVIGEFNLLSSANPWVRTGKLGERYHSCLGKSPWTLISRMCGHLRVASVRDFIKACILDPVVWIIWFLKLWEQKYLK